jgi:sugar lactone lactonase YvrE
MSLMTPPVRIAIDSQDQLGEGATWRVETQELVRVDIAQGLVHGWRPETGESWSASFDGEVGAAVPRAGDGFVVAVDHDLWLVDAGGQRTMLASAETDREANRFNDCRADPAGRLWAGTMSTLREPGVAGLYRLEAGGELERVVADTTISNGLGWSPSGELMYFIDSTTQRIDVFDYDVASGTPTARRAFAAVEPRDGLPDGLCVDADGGVWVCLFGGGAVRRYSPDGSLDAVIDMPVPHVTCPAFGGPSLETLYVTSTRHRLTAEQLPSFPQAGSVFALEPGVEGLPAGAFRG